MLVYIHKEVLVRFRNDRKGHRLTPYSRLGDVLPGPGSKRKIWLQTTLLVLLCAPLVSHSAQLILHPDTKAFEIRREKVRALFTMRLRKWEDGTQVRVFVLPDSHPAHRDFAKRSLGVFSHQLRRAWDRRVFSGTGQAPTEVKNEQEMMERVSRTPGAVGYVSDGAGGEHVLMFQVD